MLPLDGPEIKLTISASIYCTCPMWFFAAAACVKDSMICTQELYLASKKRIVMTSYTLIKFSSSNLFQLWIIGTSTYSFHSCSCPCPSAQTAFAYFRSPYWILIFWPHRLLGSSVVKNIALSRLHDDLLGCMPEYVHLGYLAFRQSSPADRI